MTKLNLYTVQSGSKLKEKQKEKNTRVFSFVIVRSQEKSV